MDATPRAAVRGEIAECTAVLTEAFFDDPVHSFIWPDADRRRTALADFFDASLRYNHLLGGGVDLVRTDAGAVAAVAVWDPPGWLPPRAADLRSLPPLARALRTRVPAAIAMRRALDRSHPARPHWYLNNIATSLRTRGVGYGALLMASRLEECDRDGLDAFLVCTRAVNVDYYRGFGFEVIEPIVVAHGGPTLWGMLRTPRVV